MKNTKRFLASLMVAVIVLTAAPLGGLVGLKLPDFGSIFSTKTEAASYNGFSYGINEDGISVTITSCYSGYFTSYVNFPSSINGYKVTRIGMDVFDYIKGITSVKIPNSVTSIAVGAFLDCDSLTRITVDEANTVYSSEDGVLFNKDKTVLMKYPNGKAKTHYTIPDSVTSIGSYAFGYCDSLASVTIPDSVTSIGNNAFYSCTGLTSITIPDSVTSIGSSAFSGCTSLTSITIPDSVTSIAEYTFSSCKSLTSITIGNSVTSISDDAFSFCTSLTSITIPDSVTSIGYYAFYYCTSLTSITIPDSVTSIGQWAFYSCNALAGIVVGSNNEYYSSDEYGALLNKEQTKLIQYPIGNTRTSYTLPNSVTIIDDNAFYNCTALTDITIPDGVKTIELGLLKGYTSLESITVDSNNEYYYSEDGVLFNKDKTQLVKYPVGNTRTSYTIPDSVAVIGSSAFYNCNRLTSVIIPDSVSLVNSGAFYGCTGLKELSMPASAVIYNNSSTFYNCTNIEKVILTKGTGIMRNYSFYSDESNTYYGYTPWHNDKCTEIIIEDGVTNIGNMAFVFCDNLESIIIPDSVTSIGNQSFRGCESLESIEIPDSVTSIGEAAFDACTGLTNINIPNSVTSIGGFVFWGCTGLTNITIGNGVTSIGRNAFDDCTSLTSITIPGSVTSINGSAFEGCTRLASVTIPDSVTSIGDSAFFGCKNLTNITIPDSVTSIGDSAFENCAGLTNITIPDSVTSIGSSAFDNTAYYKDINNWKNGVLYIDNHLIKADINIQGDYEIKNGTVTIAVNAFYECEVLTGITMPDSVLHIGNYAFYGCTGLKELTMPASAKICDSEYTFYKCTNIEKVTLTKGTGTMQNYSSSYYSPYTSPEYTPWYISRDKCSEIVIKEGITNIGQYAFSGSTSLTSITIPDGVTNIGQYAFSGCTSLTNITIPDSVTSIGWSAFYSKNLTDVYFVGTEKQWKQISISQNNDPLRNATIHFLVEEHVCSFSEWETVTEPTCTEAGTKTRSCECGEKETQVIPATGHSYSSVVTIPATHTSTGLMTHTCSCGYTYTSIISRDYYHSYIRDITLPTCTEQGYTTYICVCGDSYVADYVDAKGHTAGEWIATKPATSTQSGIKTQSCTVCGSVLNTQTIPAYGKVNSVSVSNVSLDYKSSTTLNPQISIDAGVKYTVSYSSSNPSVASVDANG